MDKHELNVKVEQMRKQAGLGDYQTAVKIADKIDWRRVSNVSLLTQVSEIYEKVGKYAEAKDILLLAVERTPMGRGLLFKLTQLALKVNSIDEAEECFEEFQRLAPQDTRQKLLRYLILKAKGAQPQQLMPPLEEYVSEELSDEWMYELAELYHRAGMREACLDLCDRITILFGTGEWVQKALRLKAEGEGEPLNEYQQSILQGEIYYQPTAGAEGEHGQCAVAFAKQAAATDFDGFERTPPVGARTGTAYDTLCAATHDGDRVRYADAVSDRGRAVWDGAGARACGTVRGTDDAAAADSVCAACRVYTACGICAAGREL